MIYVGIDDTDVIGSPGTNQLARAIVASLGPVARGAIVCRHQLLFDPRVPYTSQNGSASIQLPDAGSRPDAVLVDTVRQVMREWYVRGSDPGLAVAPGATPEMNAFAALAKSDVVDQRDAHVIAARAGCHLEELGGTGQGVIGALAAIALAAGGNDGRVVHLDGWPWPDAFDGVQPVDAIRARGVVEIRKPSSAPFDGDVVDVGKHLRPNWRDGRVVLLVEPGDSAASPWRAVKMK